MRQFIKIFTPMYAYFAYDQLKLVEGDQAFFGDTLSSLLSSLCKAAGMVYHSERRRATVATIVVMSLGPASYKISSVVIGASLPSFA